MHSRSIRAARSNYPATTLPEVPTRSLKDRSGVERGSEPPTLECRNVETPEPRAACAMPVSREDHRDPFRHQDGRAEHGIFPSVASARLDPAWPDSESAVRLRSIKAAIGSPPGITVPPVTRIGNPVRRSRAAAARSRSNESAPMSKRVVKERSREKSPPRSTIARGDRLPRALQRDFHLQRNHQQFGHDRRLRSATKPNSPIATVNVPARGNRRLMTRPSMQGSTTDLLEG